MINHYNTLNIEASSDQAIIRKAYYKLAKQFHPDKNSDLSAASKFQEISNAYKTLSDTHLRRVYDIQLILSPLNRRKRPDLEKSRNLDTKSTYEYIFNLFNKQETQDINLSKKRQRNFS